MEMTKAKSNNQLMKRLLEIRQELHQYPELSSQEFQTTEKIKNWLQDVGCTILPIETETGVVAEICGTKPGPTVAFRADIDALPIQEQTGLSFSSKIDGVSHACGHDWHTTIALGAAFIFAENRDEFSGTVRFIFQPAEETTQGAKQLVEGGLFNDGKIKAVFGLHNQPDIPAGKIGITEGKLMAAVDTLYITVNGHSGHGAIPQHTVDTVVAGSAIVMGLQTAISRNIDPFEPVVITIGKFQAGHGHNVIAGEAKLTGTVRSFNPEVRLQLPDLINRIAGEIAKGYGAKAKVDFVPQVPAINNDPVMTELVREATKEVLGEKAIVKPVPTMGGEDFSLYQEYKPGCFFWVGTGDKEKGVTRQWHDPAFVVNDDVLPETVEVVVNTLSKALQHFSKRN
ncbi:M20 family metallopeptidase [Anaerobacillus sp. MEB173]|uniref:M20 metallopeptidase family protein n=1 Tax=Anaerobacillus sp. MEB173 TaxID=3383345 RepID=UPI003F8F1D53